MLDLNNIRGAQSPPPKPWLFINCNSIRSCLYPCLLLYHVSTMLKNSIRLRFRSRIITLDLHNIGGLNRRPPNPWLLTIKTLYTLHEIEKQMPCQMQPFEAKDKMAAVSERFVSNQQKFREISNDLIFKMAAATGKLRTIQLSKICVVLDISHGRFHGI